MEVIFQYLRLGLFEKHKLLAASLLCFKVLTELGDLDAVAARALVRADAHQDPGPRGLLGDWMGETQWARIRFLTTQLNEHYPLFQQLAEDMQLESEYWASWFDSEKPEERKMPGRMRGAGPFERLLMLRALRPDRLPAAMSTFVQG